MEKDLDHEEGGLSSISDKTGHVLHRERSLPTSQDEAEVQAIVCYSILYITTTPCIEMAFQEIACVVCTAKTCEL